MSKVLYKKKGEIAYITLNRPERMNTVDWEMVSMMHKIWDDFKDDDNLRVAILNSTGKHFCAAFDVASIISLLDEGKFNWKKSALHGDINCNPIEHQVWKPIVVAVDGIANGIGLWFTLASDIRVATKEALFGFGEVKVNFPVEFTALLVRFMPFALASEMLLTGRNVSAQRFYDLGIINAIVDRDDLMNKAEAVAKDICAGGPASINVMKQLLHSGYDLDYQSIMRLSDSMISPIVNSEDTEEGLRAFTEKRKPIWKGR